MTIGAGRARALDKQGAGAHGGKADPAPSGTTEEREGFDVSGALMLGLSLWNPSYAARPDNSGHTLFRYAGHADVDLVGRRLSIPLDVSVFTDGDARPALRALAPSELDVITGVTSTWPLGPGALEIGSRVEHDRPMDGGGYVHAVPTPGVSQTYADARLRYLYSLDALVPRARSALHDGDVTGWLTLGWFALNPTGDGTYYARPDNTGRALLRYAAHTELSVFSDRLSLGYDFTFFTDSRAADPLRPSELDLTTEIIGRAAPWELHLAYERDMPADQGGLRQSFVYLLAAWGFDLHRLLPAAVTDREHLPSP